MKLRSALNILLVCTMMAGYLVFPVRAMEAPNENVISLEDLAWEWMDLEIVSPWEDVPILRTTSSINKYLAGHSIYTVSPPLSLETGDTIKINCSYSPSPTSMDFGVLTSDGRFYSINVKGGSINQTIEISQDGSYSEAIRNNSSQTVSVVGFVEY